VLDNYEDLEVIGEAGDGESAISIAAALKPDVVVMDVNMPRIDGIEATRPHRLSATRHRRDRIVGSERTPCGRGHDQGGGGGLCDKRTRRRPAL
jgi:DNA-binding NarL/FixJ family response regulator